MPGLQYRSTLHSEAVALTISVLYKLEYDDLNFLNQSIKVLRSIERPKRVLVASLMPLPSQPYLPLRIFYIILTELPGSCPPPHCLLANFTRLLLDVNSLPDRLQNSAPAFLRRLENIIGLGCHSISSFLSHHTGDALFSPHDQVRISHKEIRRHVKQFSLPERILKPNRVAAVLLEDAVLQSVVCLAVTSSYVAAPYKPIDDFGRLRCVLELAEARCIITSPEYATKLTSMYSWLSKRRIKIVITTWTKGNKIRYTDWRGQQLDFGRLPRAPPKHYDAISMIVFKPSLVVPKETITLTMWELICEAFMTAARCELGQSDVGITLASADEIGGLTRGILAPLVAGSSMACGASERCDQFWDLVQGLKPSWCLASTQDYRKILAGASLNYITPRTEENSSLRFACGADGAVPAAMASLIRDTFGCDVVSEGRPCKPFGSVWTVGQTRRRIKGYSNAGSRPETKHSHIAERTQHPCETPNFRKLSSLQTESFGKQKHDNSIQSQTTNIRKLSNRCQELETSIMRCAEIPDSPIYDCIARVVAFPAEIIRAGRSLAILLVPAPGTPRVDLSAIGNALQQYSHEKSEKPEFIVYMDALPLEDSETLRKLLTDFLDIPALADDATRPALHWEAAWPCLSPVLGQVITATQCKVDQQHLKQEILRIIPSTLGLHLEPDKEHGGFEVYLWQQERQESRAAEKTQKLAEYFKRLMALSLHAYIMPEIVQVLPRPLSVDKLGKVDPSQLRAAKANIRKQGVPEHLSSIEEGVSAAFADALSCNASEIDIETDFFTLGGDKRSAEALMAALRVEFNIDLPHTLINEEPTVRNLANYIGESYLKDQEVQHTEPYSSTRWWLLALQLVPLVTLYPARRAWQLTFQLWLLSRTKFWEDNNNLLGRIMNLLLSIYGAWASVQIIFPVTGILLKWVIIGRHKEGTYPMWGSYHTRWWLVQKIVSLCDRGFFDYCSYGKRLYFRLMGAKIGKGVTLTNVQLGEWDLLDIREGASLSGCVCRPFAVEKNSNFYLGRIVVGERSSVGALSIIAPGTEILPDTYLGANSSSWEQGQLLPRQDIAKSTSKQQEPHWLFFVGLTIPIYAVGWLIGLLPWLGPQLAVLYAKPEKSNFSPLRVILDWYQSSPQVAFAYVAVMAQSLFSPWLFLLWTVLVQYLCRTLAVHIPQHMTSFKSQVDIWRANLVKTLFDTSRFAEINRLLGQHHAARSGVLRLLGAKIGRQVSWPRSGPFIVDYELLEVDDKVTFGFDCYLFTTDEHGSGKIKIGENSVIADQVCVLPNVEIGADAMLGFGTLTERDKSYENGKTYFGRENGDIAASDSHGAALWSMNGGFPRDIDASFGQTEHNSTDCQSNHQEDDLSRLEKGDSSASRTWHSDTTWRSQHTQHCSNENARHYVFPPFITLMASTFMTIFTVFYWNVPAQSSMKLAARIFVEVLQPESTLIDPMVVYGLNYATTVALTTMFAIMAVAFVMLSKTILIGKFKPGVYSRENSNLFQRWQLHIAVEKIIRRCYVDKGILSLLTGTHWLVLYYRWLGVKIGKNCALFANGCPGLLITETDLIEIGDNVAIDDVGIIPHVEMRGSTRLDKIKIGNRCVLRSGSYILSGATMENDSCLLEHTLIMPDQIVREGDTMYRRPAKQFYGNRKGSLPKN